MAGLTLPPPDAADLGAIGPELVLAAAAIGLLVARCLMTQPSRWTGVIAYTASIAATAVAAAQLQGIISVVAGADLPGGFGGIVRPGPIFDGLLVMTPLTAVFRLLVTIALMLTAVLCHLTGVPNRVRSVDFWVLMLGATVGMLVTVSAGSVLMLFVGIEMMSVPGYVLTAYFKGRQDATESSLKYVVYGAGASGIMLYGLSLLLGLTGQTELTPLLGDTAALLTGVTATGQPAGLLALVAVLMVTVGLAFKLSAVPFHFWCPDVFTGAPAEVAGYLSVASKLATLGVMVRLVAESAGGTATVLGIALACYSIASVVFGNLAAFAQDNAKRLMAYSTIAHAGYLMLGLAAIALLPVSRRPDAVAAAVYYGFAYLLMNLTVFGGIAILRNAVGGVTLSDYRLLTRRTPRTTAVIGAVAASCFSLVGLPPFAGFFGKLLVFASAFESARSQPLMAVALAASMLMSVVSLGYYLRLLAPMVFGDADQTRRRIDVTFDQAVYVALLALGLLAMLFPLADPLLRLCQFVGRTAVPGL